MNKEYIQNIEDITDSCEMLAEKPNKFTSVFTYIIIALFSIAILWCFIGEIDYYVKASGIVRPKEGVSTIRNMVTGKVSEINIAEGSVVKKGDILFKIDTSSATQTVKNLEEQKDKLELDIKNLNKLKDCINNGENLFDYMNADEIDYYNQYEQYCKELSYSLEQYRNSNLDIIHTRSEAEITSASLKEQLEKTRSDIDYIEYLTESVENGRNMFPAKSETSIYFQKYNEYLNNIEKYNNSIAEQTQSTERMEKIYSVGGVSKVEFEKSMSNLSSLQNDLEQYKQQFTTALSQTKENLYSQKQELSASLKNAENLSGTYSQKGYSEETIKEKTNLNMKLSVSNKILSQQNTLDSLISDLSELKYNLACAEVAAPIDGTVNMYAEVSQDDFIQSGTDIATIVPNSDGKYKIQIYINSADISEVKSGQKVKLRFSALPYQEYGELMGTISNISTDSRTDSTTGMSFYIAECIADEDFIAGKDGEKNKILTGMECEARVITKQRKIIYWLLEKLNFID